ncbi:MAG: hypothetical protein LAO05_04480 [Acidobacteriia bacterium]|nr:hypothetical protein [Terriglobia bacterium]
MRDHISRRDQYPRVGDDHAVDEDVSGQNLVLGTGVGSPQHTMGSPREALLL